MSNVKDFLKRKDIVITPQRYLIEALGAMAQGLFASLLIGTIMRFPQGSGTTAMITGSAIIAPHAGYPGHQPLPGWPGSLPDLHVPVLPER